MEKIVLFATTNWELFLALAVILALLLRTLVLPSTVKLLSSQEAVRMMNQDGALVLDVRANDEYQQGHIANVMHMALPTIQSRLAELAPYKESAIIVCCRSGNRSHQAGVLLKKQGFALVFNLKGGMMEWQNSGLPVTTKPGKPPAPVAKIVSDPMSAAVESPPQLLEKTAVAAAADIEDAEKKV